jgi:hypothetical protein
LVLNSKPLIKLEKKIRNPFLHSLFLAQTTLQPVSFPLKIPPLPAQAARTIFLFHILISFRAKPTSTSGPTPLSAQPQPTFVHPLPPVKSNPTAAALG